MEQPETPDLLVQQVQLAKALQALLDLKVMLEQLDLLESKVLLETLVQLDQQDLPEQTQQ